MQQTGVDKDGNPKAGRSVMTAFIDTCNGSIHWMIRRPSIRFAQTHNFNSCLAPKIALLECVLKLLSAYFVDRQSSSAQSIPSRAKLRAIIQSHFGFVQEKFKGDPEILPDSSKDCNPARQDKLHWARSKRISGRFTCMYSTMKSLFAAKYKRTSTSQSSPSLRKRRSVQRFGPDC